MLVYYDKWAYKLGNKRDSTISLNNENDIDHLNFLQTINCNSIVFSNSLISETYLSKLAKRAINLRNQDLTNLKEINESYTDAKGFEPIQYTQFGNNKNINLQLTFIKETKNAKSHNLSDFVIQLRNEKLRNKK